jgi:hypothetical protein
VSSVAVRLEAIYSVSASHDPECTCLVCRAANGDPRAMVEVLDQLALADIVRGDS